MEYECEKDVNGIRDMLTLVSYLSFEGDLSALQVNALWQNLIITIVTNRPCAITFCGIYRKS